MWNPQDYRNKVEPAAKKLVDQLYKEGIYFTSTDGDLNNVIFRKGDKIIKISHHSFYRYSGIMCITRDKKGENNVSEAIPVSDDMYMQTIIKPIIYILLDKA